MCTQLINLCSNGEDCSDHDSLKEHIPNALVQCDKKLKGEYCAELKYALVRGDKRQPCKYCSGKQTHEPLATMNVDEDGLRVLLAGSAELHLAPDAGNTSNTGPRLVIRDPEGRLPPYVPIPLPQQWTIWREKRPTGTGWDSKAARYQRAVEHEPWKSYWCPLPHELEEKFYDRQRSVVQVHSRTQQDLEQAYWDWRRDYVEFEPVDDYAKKRQNRAYKDSVRKKEPTTPATSPSEFPPEIWLRWNKNPATATDPSSARYLEALQAYPEYPGPLPYEPKDSYFNRQRDRNIVHGRTDEVLNQVYDNWMRNYPGLQATNP